MITKTQLRQVVDGIGTAIDHINKGESDTALVDLNVVRTQVAGLVVEAEPDPVEETEQVSPPTSEPG